MKNKNLNTGVLLTTLFGPLGMLYTSFVGAFAYFTISIVLSILFTFLYVTTFYRNSPTIHSSILDIWYLFLLIIFLHLRILGVFVTYKLYKFRENNILSEKSEKSFIYSIVEKAISSYIVCLFIALTIFAYLSNFNFLKNTSDIFQIRLIFILTFVFIVIYKNIKVIKE